METTPAHRLHRALMDLLRLSGLLQNDQQVLGHPVSLSQSFALDELDPAAPPPSQQELAEYAGMTHVHLNRCLKELREARLVTFAQGWAKVLDWERLKDMAHFDEAYLNLRLIEV